MALVEQPLTVIVQESDSIVVEVAGRGATGPQGPAGATGATGPQGVAGAAGAPGVGIPVGGTTGQYLRKATDTDYDTEWNTSSASVLWGGVTGTLSDQLDLVSALGGKSDTGHTHTGTYEPANANIQTHIADTSVHFAQSSISITESQISDLGTYEPAFTKNTAFNKDFGTLVGTVCQGNDARLSDARTPTAHTHVEADITDLDKYSQSQVDTLLTGKSDTSHLHTGVYQPVPAAGTVQTTDAIATTLHSVAIPTGEQRIVVIRVRGSESTSGDTFWKTMTIGVKNVAGTASLVGGFDSAVGYDAGASAWSVVAGVSSGNVTVTVTGEALKTIDWVSSIDTY